MSGGGGHYYSPSNSTSVSEAVAASNYDANANAYLQELLSGFNDRDVEAISRHLDTLQQAIEKEIEGEVKTLFGGSVRKHTYVDGLSDIDVLMIVNNSSLANATPAQVLKYLEQRISERLAHYGVQVKAGDLAVTVRYADGIEIQVLPALKTATGVQIAKQDGGWSNVVRPQEFAKKLTAVNKQQNGKVVPTIKLFKGLQTQLPANDQLKGYHLESLAIEAFRAYTGRSTPKDMLQHFVKFAATQVKTPIKDTTGQSLHVDDYLGAAVSTDRQRISLSLTRLANKLEAAEKSGSISDLKSIF